jgi:hypothetical protein
MDRASLKTYDEAQKERIEKLRVEAAGDLSRLTLKDRQALRADDAAREAATPPGVSTPVIDSEENWSEQKKHWKKQKKQQEHNVPGPIQTEAAELEFEKEENEENQQQEQIDDFQRRRRQQEEGK